MHCYLIIVSFYAVNQCGSVNSFSVKKILNDQPIGQKNTITIEGISHPICGNPYPPPLTPSIPPLHEKQVGQSRQYQKPINWFYITQDFPKA